MRAQEMRKNEWSRFKVNFILRNKSKDCEKYIRIWKISNFALLIICDSLIYFACSKTFKKLNIHVLILRIASELTVKQNAS